jgi:hypothetical protein
LLCPFGLLGYHLGVTTPLVLLLIDDPSAETTQAAPGMIPPRLVI